MGGLYAEVTAGDVVDENIYPIYDTFYNKQRGIQVELTYLFLLAALSGVVSFSYSYCGQLLALEVRRSVMDQVHEKYFSPRIAFRFSNLVKQVATTKGTPASYVSQADARLVSDVRHCSEFLERGFFGGPHLQGMIGGAVQVAVFFPYVISKSPFVGLLASTSPLIQPKQNPPPPPPPHP